MRDTIKKIKSVVWLIFILGLLAIAAVVVLDHYFPYYSRIYFVSLVSIIGVLVCFVLVASYIGLFNFEKRRYLSDLKTIDIIGGDVEAAYAFGELGMIVTDEKGVVLWCNDLLLDRGMNFVDKNIEELSSSLSDMLHTSSADGSFKYNEKYYAVKLIKSANLFIIKDTTEYESLLKYNTNHSLVIGYLNLDNFSDIQASDELAFSEIESSLRKTISDYFKDFKCIIKLIRQDFFMLVLSYESLELLKKDKFSIINTIGKDFEAQGLTASLGFGYGFPDFIKNNELANNALDVALSRGGNQCVLSPFGDNMMFFAGGNTESKSTSSKIKTKSYSKAFVNCLLKAKNVLIVPHIYADIDAIGACLAVYSICRGQKNPIKANILYESQSIERMTDQALRSALSPDYFENVFISSRESKDFVDKDTLIVVLDHNKPSLSIYPDLYAGEECKIAIIDHHRKQDTGFYDTEYEYIDSSASSTCEILALFLDSFPYKINVPKEIATLMLSGIYLDTNNFKGKTSIDTHEASIILTRLGADEQEARDYLKESYETFVVKSKILSNIITPSYGVVIARGDENENVDSAMLAMVCNELRDLQGTKVCFAIGKIDQNSVYISSRGDGTVNCEYLMQKMGGGGHFSSAACMIKNTTIKDSEIKLKHVLDEYLKDASSQNDKGENDESNND